MIYQISVYSLINSSTAVPLVALTFTSASNFEVKAGEFSDIEKCDDLEMFFNQIGVNYSHADVTPHYSPLTDSVSIPKINRFETTDQYYATLGHEFIHWTAHKSRLARDLTGRMSGSMNQKSRPSG